MGAGNPTVSGETETQVPAACQPRQPHTWTVAYQALSKAFFLQARVLEWVAISFSRGSSRPRD